jgi:hypothetical protein
VKISMRSLCLVVPLGGWGCLDPRTHPETLDGRGQKSAGLVEIDDAGTAVQSLLADPACFCRGNAGSRYIGIVLIQPNVDHSVLGVSSISFKIVGSLAFYLQHSIVSHATSTPSFLIEDPQGHHPIQHPPSPPPDEVPHRRPTVLNNHDVSVRGCGEVELVGRRYRRIPTTSASNHRQMRYSTAALRFSVNITNR